MKLRPYQKKWLQRIRKAPGRVLVVGPTGAGKTVVAVSLIGEARLKRKRVLFLAHRTELVNQCVSRLRDAGIEDVGVIQADTTPDPGQPVQVASVQTLARRPELMTGYDVVIIDEAHHATSPTYRKILDVNDGAKVYGLTATPRRLDGKPLSDLFDSVAQSEPVSKLIEIGALNHPRVFSVSADLVDIKTRGGDYAREDLSRAFNTNQLLGDAVAHWERFAEGRPTVVYSVDVAHAEATVARFRAAGHRAQLITGETPGDERATILRGLNTGDVQIVVNVEVLTEGWDCPDVSCAVILRPTMSETLAFQMAGRAMRRNPKWPHAIILDHAGNYILHGLPSEDRDYSDVLTEGQVSQRRHGDNAARSKSCPECGSEVSFGSRVCGFCEHEFWIAGPPPEAEGWLVEVSASKRGKSDAVRNDALRRLLDGENANDIATEIGASQSAIWTWAKNAGLTPIGKGRHTKWYAPGASIPPPPLPSTVLSLPIVDGIKSALSGDWGDPGKVSTKKHREIALVFGEWCAKEEKGQHWSSPVEAKAKTLRHVTPQTIRDYAQHALSGSLNRQKPKPFLKDTGRVLRRILHMGLERGLSFRFTDYDLDYLDGPFDASAYLPPEAPWPHNISYSERRKKALSLLGETKRWNTRSVAEVTGVPQADLWKWAIELGYSRDGWGDYTKWYQPSEYRGLVARHPLRHVEGLYLARALDEALFGEGWGAEYDEPAEPFLWRGCVGEFTGWYEQNWVREKRELDTILGVNRDVLLAYAQYLVIRYCADDPEPVNREINRLTRMMRFVLRSGSSIGLKLNYAECDLDDIESRWATSDKAAE